MMRRGKIELHLHLDCSLSHQVAERLEPGLSRAQYESEFIAPKVCTSLADFLTRAPRGFQLMQTGDALAAVTEDLFEQLAADEVLYAEIRFAPLLHTLRGMTPEKVVAAVDRTTERMVEATGIEARIILCTLRHFTEEESLETAQLVDRFEGSRVVALDLAGDEAGHAIHGHVPAFVYARERDIPRTAHAGEARGADSIWETLDAFAPSRIGHGVRCIEDPALVERLRRDHIHLEICPSSNVQTQACRCYEEHPVDRLFREGVSLSINTDTRTITNVTLEQEYTRLRETFGWGDAEFEQCNEAALRAAFVDEITREKLTAELAKVGRFQ